MKEKRFFPVLLVVWLVITGFTPIGLKTTAAVQPTQTPEPIRRRSLSVFNQCTPEQKASLERALAAAKKLALNAFQVLKFTPQSQRASSTRYQEWFGPYDLSNYETAMAQFERIYNALVIQTIAFSCDCNEVWEAFVYLDHPYEIHLCTAYWLLPETGTDTQAGILVHEISHFPQVAGTKDEVYNHQIARIPAGWTSPATAIVNAASYQYFAENDPAFEPRVPDVSLKAIRKP